MNGGVVAAREVSDLGALNLDYTRAQIRQLARSERRGDRLLQRTTVIPASGSISMTWADPERAPPDNSG